jgi:ribosomal RNA-processing protein 8
MGKFCHALIIRGELMIAEVTSRFIDRERFVSTLKNLGFKLESMDDSNKMFVLFYLKKIDDPVSIDKTSFLKPCIYKRR